MVMKIYSNIFSKIKESKLTRRHDLTLVKEQSRLDVRKYSFSQRTVNVWNKLSTDCVHASSVGVFKNRIDEASHMTWPPEASSTVTSSFARHACARMTQKHG